MSSTASAELALMVSRDHPALPGHFPGRPIVPGVVLLDRVIDAAERWLGRPVQVESLQQIKFLLPLLPGDEAHVRLRLEGATTLHFAVERASASIARGTVALRAAAAGLT